MKSNKNIFKKNERGLAIETAQERHRPFGENLDGTSHVPNDPLKTVVTDIKKKKVKSPKRKF
jgi:hypothetical protein